MALKSTAQTLIFYPGSVKTWTSTPAPGEWTRLPEAFERLWHVNDSAYREFAQRCKGRDAVVRAAAAAAGAAPLFERAEQAETQQDVAALAEEIGALPPALRQACRTAANTSLGLRQESSGLEQFAAEFGVEVERPRNRFAAIVLATPDFLVQVCGRVDGLAVINGRRTVLEVKTRTRRLNRRVAQEQAQLELYLRLLDCERGVLVETFKGTMQATPYARNDGYYRRLMSRLQAFAGRFAAFLQSTEAKLRYTDMSEQERINFVAEMIGEKVRAARPERGPERGQERGQLRAGSGLEHYFDRGDGGSARGFELRERGSAVRRSQPHRLLASVVDAGGHEFRADARRLRGEH